MSAAIFLLQPAFQPWATALFDVASQYGLHPTVTSTYRSIQEQTELYQKYLRGESEYPVAPPGQSAHNYGLAFDMVSDNNAWLGAVWQAWGGSWSTRDNIHFGI